MDAKASTTMAPPLALVLLAAGLAAAVLSYIAIVRAYRRRTGFPWLASLGFAAAAVAALAALRALLSP